MRRAPQIHDDEFVQRVPELIRQALVKVPTDCWTLDDLPYMKKYSIDRITSVLRYSFWAEYHRAMEEDRPMVDTNIYAGICAKSSYYQRIKVGKNIGYMLRPPANYIRSLEEIADIGLAKLREIMSAPILNGKGQMNTAAAKIMLQAFHMVDQRLKGAVAIKHEVLQKNLNVNLGSMPTSSIALHEKASNMDLLDAKIKSLEQKLKPGTAESLKIGAIELEAKKLE